MSVNSNASIHALSQEGQDFLSNFNRLSTDDKLALFYFIYEDMGDSVTPAAPTAADPNLAPILLGDFYELSDDQQLQIMRDIVECKDTPYSRAYGGLGINNQLAVWYAWAQAMGDTVVDLPDDYQTMDAIENVLTQIEGLEFEQQISTLRDLVGGMGYSEVEDIPSQSDTGKTPSL